MTGDAQVLGESCSADPPKGLEEALADVATVLTSTLPHVLGIQIVGSLGRGEARFCVDREGWRIANDVDLLVLTETGIDPALAQDAGRMCTELLHCPHTDVGAVSLETLGLAAPTILNVDVRHASRCLWGVDISGLLPELPTDSLPISEALTVALNRLHCLLEAHPDRRGGNEDYRSTQTMKAIEGLVESRLIRARRYDPAYREKTRRFLADPSIPPEWRRLAEWAGATRFAAQDTSAPPRWPAVRDAVLDNLEGIARAALPTRARGPRHMSLSLASRPARTAFAVRHPRATRRTAAGELRRGRVSAAQYLLARSAPPSDRHDLRPAAALLGRRLAPFAILLESAIDAWFAANGPA